MGIEKKIKKPNLVIKADDEFAEEVAIFLYQLYSMKHSPKDTKATDYLKHATAVRKWKEQNGK